MHAWDLHARGSGRLSYEELETLVAEQTALIDALQARITAQAAVIEELERSVSLARILQ